MGGNINISHNLISVSTRIGSIEFKACKIPVTFL